MATMPLGKSGLAVAPLALGGNVFGWTADEATSFSILDAFVEAGFNLIDTADVYSQWVPGNRGGESETIIGKWLKRSGRRRDVVIATKVGMELSPDCKGLSKAYIMQAAEASLARLGIDCIDLYQSHVDDPHTPLEETLEAYRLLIEQGKVRAIGASNFDADRLRQSLDTSQGKGLPRYESLQTLYNLYDRSEFETALRDTCREEELGVLTYFSLGAGFLTGKYRSQGDLAGQARGRMVARYLNPRGMRILDAMDQVARERSATPAMVGLAWLVSHPEVTAPIASATSVEQLGELMRGVRMQLTDEERRMLDDASAY